MAEKCGLNEGTHYHGCECHERQWQEKVDKLEVELTELRELKQLLEEMPDMFSLFHEGSNWYSALAHIERLEANTGAMRELLIEHFKFNAEICKYVMKRFNWDGKIETTELDHFKELGRNTEKLLLSSSAGSAILERMRTLEAAVDVLANELVLVTELGRTPSMPKDAEGWKNMALEQAKARVTKK
jgi:hypothetical protein